MPKDASLQRLQRAWLTSARLTALPAASERIEQLAGCALSRPARYALLNLRDGGPQHVSGLAASTGVDVSTMSRTLRPLHAAGLVQRAPGDDQRAVLISITAAGVETLSRVVDGVQQMLYAVMADWPEDDIDELARLLDRFATDLAANLGLRAQAAAPKGDSSK